MQVQQGKLDYQFVPLPVNLLRVPEVIKYFVPSTEFALLTSLHANIRRVDTGGVKSSRKSWQYAIADMYEKKGILATFATWDLLSEWVNMSERHTQRLVKRLIDARLIEMERFGHGFIIYLGDGKNKTFLEEFGKKSREDIVGILLATKFITKGLRPTELQKMEEIWGKKFVEKVLKIESKYRIPPTRIFRISGSKTTGKRASKKSKNASRVRKNATSSKSPVQDSDSDTYSRKAAGQADNNSENPFDVLFPKNDTEGTPSSTQTYESEKKSHIDKRIDNSKTLLTFSPKTDSKNPGEKGSKSVNPLFKNRGEEITPAESALARVKSETSWTAAERAAREALRNGVPLDEVNRALATRVPPGYREQYAKLPRTAYRLHRIDTYEDVPKNEHTLSTLWRALAEDITGVNHAESSKFYTEVRGAYKTHVLGVFSWDQVLWTFRRSLSNPRTVEFLAQGGRNIIPVIKQNAMEYHRFYQERVARERRKEWEAAAAKQREEDRIRDQKHHEEQVKLFNEKMENDPEFRAMIERRQELVRRKREADQRMKEIRRAGNKQFRN